ncbi:MAG: methyl-accepting chemotaxis protein [Planctomycetaceae bacterium]
MFHVRRSLADVLHRLANRISSLGTVHGQGSESPLQKSLQGPELNAAIPGDVELAAGVRVLQILSGQLQQTAMDIQDSIVRVSTGFAGMAQQAASAVQLSQCRVQSREGMNKVLDAARKTLDEVDTIAREARMVGLNGQIEAARAGQQGIAFSVVANETKSLALHAATTSDMLKRMLNELAELHEQLVDALQSSESTSECLSREITRAVMGLQFQDRVNQQLQHITETLDAIYDRAVPITEQVPARKVAARLEDWREWMQSRSTMESERTVAGSCSASPSIGNDAFGSVELF